MALNFGKLNFSVAFNPTSAFPLDARSYFESYELAVAAAQIAVEAGKADSTYYYGQTLVVNENAKATLYIIQPDKTLKEVGSVPIGDEQSIEVIDSKIKLKGFGNKYYQYQEEIQADGTHYKLVENEFKAGLEPKVRLVREGVYELAWYEPNPFTVEELSSTIDLLTETVNTNTTNINSNLEKIEVLESKADTFTTNIETLSQTAQDLNTAITNEIARAKAAEQVNAEAIAVEKARIDTFLDAEGIKNTTLDTLKEIQDFITSEANAADQMITEINANKTAIEAEAKARSDKDIELNNLIETNKINLENLEKAVENNTQSIEDFIQDINLINQTIINKETTLNERINGVESTLAGRITANDEAIIELNRIVEEHTSQLPGLEQAINTVSADLVTVTTKANNNESAIANLSNTVEGYKTALDEKDNELAQLIEANRAAIETLSNPGESLIELHTRLDALERDAHTHVNKDLLDTYTQTEVDLSDAVLKKHTHDNKNILDGIEASHIQA